MSEGEVAFPVDRRKRKESRSSRSLLEESRHGASSDDGRRGKRKCCIRDPKSRGNALPGSRSGSKKGIVMTAPPSAGCCPATPGRGLKRKIGCIESATRIGRKKKLESEYDLGDEIGHGKFGSVRICRSKVTGEQCACKTLAKKGEETAHREVEIMQHLSGHPGIVTLRAVFEDAENFFLVMEFCSGGRLMDRLLEEGRFSEQKAAVVVKNLMLVIEYCHEMGVVHRDIKPENVLFTKTGKMKLADFGLAARVTNGQQLSGIAGSPAYVAPEVLLGMYSEKVDVWASGILLHALLVGTLPFQGDSLDAVFEAIKTTKLDFSSGPWESVSKLARNLVSRMLGRDPSSRITPSEILRHPWILFYTETEHPARVLLQGSHAASEVQRERTRLPWGQEPSSPPCSLSPEEGEDQDEASFADVLTVAIAQVRISEPKRSRICSIPVPIIEQCSSNLKSNLCPAF